MKLGMFHNQHTWAGSPEPLHKTALGSSDSDPEAVEDVNTLWHFGKTLSWRMSMNKLIWMMWMVKMSSFFCFLFCNILQWLYVNLWLLVYSELLWKMGTACMWTTTYDCHFCHVLSSVSDYVLVALPLHDEKTQLLCTHSLTAHSNHSFD